MALVTARVDFKLSASETKIADLAVAVGPLDVSKTFSFTAGAGLNQADRIWHDNRTTAATDSHDVSGAMVDVFGGTFILARLKALYVFNALASTGNARVTRPAANGVPLFLAAGDAIEVVPGGMFAWVAPSAAGIVVTAATGDLIDIVASAGSVTYDIVIIGSST